MTECVVDDRLEKSLRQAFSAVFGDVDLGDFAPVLDLLADFANVGGDSD